MGSLMTKLPWDKALVMSTAPLLEKAEYFYNRAAQYVTTPHVNTS